VALATLATSSGGSLGAWVDRHRSRAAVGATSRLSRCILHSTWRQWALWPEGENRRRIAAGPCIC